jgi:hypothetical protein
VGLLSFFSNNIETYEIDFFFVTNGGSKITYNFKLDATWGLLSPTL